MSTTGSFCSKLVPVHEFANLSMWLTAHTSIKSYICTSKNTVLPRNLSTPCNLHAFGKGHKQAGVVLAATSLKQLSNEVFLY